MVLAQDQAEQYRQPLVDSLTKSGDTEAAALVSGLKSEIFTMLLNAMFSQLKDYLSKPENVASILELIFGMFTKK